MRARGEDPPPRICDGCGKEFRRRPRPSRLTFCSAGCYRAFQRRSAEDRAPGGDDGSVADEDDGVVESPRCRYCRQPVVPTDGPHGEPEGWYWCKVCGGYPGSFVRVDHRLQDLKGPRLARGP